MSISQSIEHNSICLTRSFAQGSWGHSLHVVLVIALVLVASARIASADANGAPAADEPILSLDSRLKAFYVAIGPIGVVQRAEGNWDSAFGAELNLTRVRESAAISALGLSIGGSKLSERDGGRFWLGALAGIDRLPGKVPIGLSLGGILDVDAVRHARWGGYATLWFYAGVMPFVRVSTIQKSGSGVELGLSIPLPAFSL